MKPDSLASTSPVRTRIRELLEQQPNTPGEREEWLERIIQAVSEPLETAQAELNDLRRQLEHSRAAEGVLRAENKRLRARLAGVRQNETAVQERAEAFRTLAENSPDLILRIDRQMKHVYANQAAADLLGCTADELLGRPLSELPIYEPALEHFNSGPNPFQTGEELRTLLEYPDEEGRRYYDVRIVPEPDAGGRVETVLVVARDITDLKTAEAALRSSEERFRIASDGAGLAIFEQDSDLVYTWGYGRPLLSDEPVLGKRDSDLLAPPDAEALTALKKQVLATGRGLRRELQIETPRGPRSLDVILEPLRGEDGKVTGLLGAYADITQRKETERELAYRSLLLENVHDAIISTDSNLRITTWNAAAAELYGWQAADVIGKHLYQVIPTDFTSGDHFLSLEKLRSGKVFHMELKQHTRAGRLVFVESYGMALFDEHGAVSGFVCANRDITARRLLEQENEAHRQSLVAQRELLQSIIQGNPSGIAVISGKDFRFQIVNTAYRAIVPHPEIDPTGRTLEEVWPAGEGFNDTELLRQVVSEEASITLERVERRYPDGSVRYLTLHARPIAWTNAPAALLVVWETTQLEKALQEAEEGRRMLEGLMEYIPESIILISALNERILLASKYAAGEVGLRRADLEGQPLEAYAPASKVFTADGSDPVPREKLPGVRAVRAGEVVEGEELAFYRDGALANLLLNAGPIRDLEGRIFAAVVTLRDITERKREEANNRFLSELSQAMVTMTTPEQVVREAPEQVGRYLKAARCFICEFQPDKDLCTVRADYHPGLSSLTGSYRISKIPLNILRRMKQGKPVVIADLAADPLTADHYQDMFAAQSVRALIILPWLDWQGKLAGSLVVANVSPRTWQPDELGLLHSVAHLTRLTLENTTLFGDLKDFRQRFELAIGKAPITVFTADKDLRVTWEFNPPKHFKAEPPVGLSSDESEPSTIGAPLYELARLVLSTGKGDRRELRFETRHGAAYHDVTIEPLFDERGEVSGVAVASMETTQLRRMEAEAVKNLAQIEVQHRLIAERELERTRIARDLHDGPLQDLIAASYNLVEAMDISEKEPRLAKMRQIQEMLQEQIRALRRFCNDLRPPVLAPFGLEKTIRSHAENLRELYPELKINLKLQRDGKRLSEDRRMTLFRVYQELMNNVLRHSNATEVTISLRLYKGRVQLEVIDNGVGFNRPDNWLELARQGHLGLVGVRERAEMVGGKVEMFSEPHRGTRVRVIVPL